MIPVKFTQYLRPDGRRKAITLQVPDFVGEMAMKVTAAGYHFDAEVLQDEKTVSFTCEPDEPGEDGDDQPISMELVENGPGVGEAIHRLVAEALAVIEGGRSEHPN